MSAHTNKVLHEDWGSFSVDLDSMRIGDSATSHAKTIPIYDTGQSGGKRYRKFLDDQTKTLNNIGIKDAGDTIGAINDKCTGEVLRPIGDVDDLQDLAPLPPDGGYGYLLIFVIIIGENAFILDNMVGSYIYIYIVA